MHPEEARATAQAALELADVLAQAPASIPPELTQYGAWTPTDGSGAGLVFTSAAGAWKRIGRLVIASWLVVYPVTADASTNRVNGLPFQTTATPVQRQGFISYSDFGATIYVLPQLSDTYVRFFSAAGVGLTNAALSGKQVYGTVIYEAAS